MYAERNCKGDNTGDSLQLVYQNLVLSEASYSSS